MNNASRTNLINQGFRLGRQLDDERDRLRRTPVPDTWQGLGWYPSVASVVDSIKGFDDEADRTIRILNTTLSNDTTATLALTLGLLPGIIRRFGHQPHRIGEAMTELALFIAERHMLTPKRAAGQVVLDEVHRRTRRALQQQHDYEQVTLTLIEDFTDGAEEINAVWAEPDAILNVQVDRCRASIDRSPINFDLDTIAALSEQRRLSPALRKQLSRGREQVRPIIERELTDIA